MQAMFDIVLALLGMLAGAVLSQFGLSPQSDEDSRAQPEVRRTVQDHSRATPGSKPPVTPVKRQPPHQA